MTIASSYNAEVIGFNANGLVLVRARNGSIVTAAQTGNGKLEPGQPVVLQQSGVPGIASTCFDPAGVAVPTRVWPKQEEELKTDDWEYATIRSSNAFNYLHLSNSAGMPLPKAPIYSQYLDPATGLRFKVDWVSMSPAKLREYGHMSIGQFWTTYYAVRNFTPLATRIDEYGNLRFVSVSPPLDLGLNAILAGNEIKFVLRAKRALTVTRIRASSSFQPGGPQFDPSPTGQSLTHTEGAMLAPQKLRQILDFSAIRQGKEINDIASTYLTGIDLSHQFWDYFNLSRAWYDGDVLSTLINYNDNTQPYRQQYGEGGYNSYRRTGADGSGPLELSGPGITNTTPVKLEDVANIETILNHMQIVAKRQTDSGFGIGVPVKVSNMATFSRKPLLGGSQRELLSYSATPKAGTARFAKGDLMYIYSSAGYYNWKPGDTPWQLQGIDTL